MTVLLWGTDMRMTAAIATAPDRDFEIVELDMDDPRADEILVRIVAVGLCHTDLAARSQLIPIGLPAVFGHEGAGIVERIGSAITKVAPGDHVVLTFRSCSRCEQCLARQPAYCDYHPHLNFIGMRPDGSKTLRRCDDPVSSNFFGQSSFASHALAYESNVVKVDETIPLDRLAPLGCAVQTGAGAVLRALCCGTGTKLLITGAGPVGLSAVLGARLAGCATIIVSDPISSRRALALQLGATHALDPADGDMTSFVRNIVPPGLDYALDTTGIPAVMNAALGCLRRHGTLGLIGIPHPPEAPTPGLAIDILSAGITIRGIVEGDSDPDKLIPELIELYKEGKFPFDTMITAYPFSAINQAVDDQANGRCVKAVLILPLRRSR